MEIKVKLHTINIKDDSNGKSFKVKSLRSAEDIASYVEESEKDEIIESLEQAVNDELNKG